MLKYIINLITLSVLISCANTRTIYKDITYPPKLSLKNGKYKTIEIVELKSHDRPLSFHEKILNEGSKFHVQSFINTLENKIIDSKKLVVIHRATDNEVIHNTLTNKKIRNTKADLGIYGTYQERQGLESYSNDAAGQGSPMLYAHGRFTFRIIDSKSGKVLYTDTLSWKNRTYKSDADVFLGKITTETLAQTLRRSLALKFTKIFSAQTYKRSFEFKEGNDEKFIKVIGLIDQGKLNMALVEQNTILLKLTDENEISDAHYNTALIYLLKNDKEEALKAAQQISNGFFQKDFTQIRNIIMAI
jgi:hypothetical protein